jgi:hypothetical protein
MRERARLERERAECFDRAAAVRLSPAPCHEAAAVREDVWIATRLAALDFRDESRIQASLGAQLDRLADSPSAPASHRTPRGTLRLAFALGVVALILTMLHPGARAAVLDAIRGIVTLLSLGRHSRVVHVDRTKESATEADARAREHRRALEEGTAWDVDIPGVLGATGPVLPGAEPVVRYVSSLRIAAGLAAVDLMAPARLPGCPDARAAFRRAFVTPDGGAILVYETPGGTIALQEMPVGWMLAPDGSRQQIFRATGSAASAAQAVTVRGQRLGWLPEEDRSSYGTLVWEKDDIGYELWGDRLTVEQAEEVFLSLEPCPKPSRPAAR